MGFPVFQCLIGQIKKDRTNKKYHCMGVEKLFLPNSFLGVFQLHMLLSRYTRIACLPGKHLNPYL
jgi:hypothetical protein